MPIPGFLRCPLRMGYTYFRKKDTLHMPEERQ